MPCEDRGRQTTEQERLNYEHEQKVWAYKRQEVESRGGNPKEAPSLSGADFERITAIIGRDDATPARVEELKAQLNRVTQLLCAVMKSGQVLHTDWVPGLMEWWGEHQAGDQKVLREQALAKLTHEERIALRL